MMADMKHSSLTCKLCLEDVSQAQLFQLSTCKCQFCKECLQRYVSFAIQDKYHCTFGCPDWNCSVEGKLTEEEIQQLSTSELFERYQKLRLEREIELDPRRTFCPAVNCGAVCEVSAPWSTASGSPPSREIEEVFLDNDHPQSDTSTSRQAVLQATEVPMGWKRLKSFSFLRRKKRRTPSEQNNVGHTTPLPMSALRRQPAPATCPTCQFTFCAICKLAWHPDYQSCDEASIAAALLTAHGPDADREGAEGGPATPHNQQSEEGIPFVSFDVDSTIKRCPVCNIPIERNDGCAQMMCKRCKHVFCWYCLVLLDDDFLLSHYDKGPCKDKLGHSRASVFGHRIQVIGIFAGFTVLMILAAPFLLIAAPCILCYKCHKICHKLRTAQETSNMSPEANLSGTGVGLSSADKDGADMQPANSEEASGSLESADVSITDSSARKSRNSRHVKSPVARHQAGPTPPVAVGGSAWHRLKDHSDRRPPLTRSGVGENEGKTSAVIEDRQSC